MGVSPLALFRPSFRCSFRLVVRRHFGDSDGLFVSRNSSLSSVDVLVSSSTHLFAIIRVAQSLVLGCCCQLDHSRCCRRLRSPSFGTVGFGLSPSSFALLLVNDSSSDVVVCRLGFALDRRLRLITSRSDRSALVVPFC